MAIVCFCNSIRGKEVVAATQELCARQSIKNPKTLPHDVVEYMGLNLADRGCSMKSNCMRTFTETVFEAAGIKTGPS